MCRAVDIFTPTTCALFHIHPQHLGLVQRSVDKHHLEFNWKQLSKMQWAGDNCWQAVVKGGLAEQEQGGGLDELLTMILDVCGDEGGNVATDDDKEAAVGTAASAASAALDEKNMRAADKQAREKAGHLKDNMKVPHTP